MSSAIGGAILISVTMSLGGFALPSLPAYRTLFAICAGAAIVGAGVALVIPQARQAGQADRMPPRQLTNTNGRGIGSKNI